MINKGGDTKYIWFCHRLLRPFIALTIFTMAKASSKKAAAGKDHRISLEHSIYSPVDVELD
jgi:hypothetical protein